MYTRPRVSRAIVLAALAFALTGCTAFAGLPGKTSTTTATTTTTTTTTRPSPYLTTKPTLELSDRTTKPGATLKFGEQAVVPFYSYYAKGLLGISVTVENVRARDSDIDGLHLKDEDKASLRGKTFFYVHETLVNIDGVDLSSSTAPVLSPTTRSGGFPGTLLGFGNTGVTGCQDHAGAPVEFTAKGATFESCRWYFGEDDDPIASLSYTDQPYERSDTGGVTWRDR